MCEHMCGKMARESIILCWLRNICMCVYLFHICRAQRHTVNCTAGLIVGLMDEVSIDGVTYEYRKYLGIPYAKPPTGELRYEKPLPLPTFTSPYDATVNREMCIQDFSNQRHSMRYQQSENCLYLNIYAPGDADISVSKAVIVFIHGGVKEHYFKDGGSDFFIGDMLSVYGDVIVVTFNYRLSIFGFFGTNDNTSARNFALWDQHQALVWVNKNIASFGGDPSHVTILGQSAGAVSAVYQALYPPNKGLFQRIILENGSPISIADSNIKPSLGTSASLDAAESLACYKNNGTATLECMRTKSVRSTMRNVWGEFYPVVDYDFVLADPLVILQSKNGYSEIKDFFSSLDIIIGVNMLDATMHVKRFWNRKFSNWFQHDNQVDASDTIVSRQTFERAVMYSLGEEIYGYLHSDSDIVRQTVLGRYTPLQDVQGNGSADVDDSGMLYKFTLDYKFLIPVLKTAIIHAGQSGQGQGKTYLYQINMESVGSTSGEQIFEQGALYTFGFSEDMLRSRQLRIRPTSEQAELSKTIMKLWTNFAKSGNPTSDVDTDIHWPVFKSGTAPYLEISSTLPVPSSETNYGEPSASFWLGLMTYLVQLESERTRNIFIGPVPDLVMNKPTTSSAPVAGEREPADTDEVSHFRMIVIVLAAVTVFLFVGFVVLGGCVFCSKHKLRQQEEMVAL